MVSCCTSDFCVVFLGVSALFSFHVNPFYPSRISRNLETLFVLRIQTHRLDHRAARSHQSKFCHQPSHLHGEAEKWGGGGVHWSLSGPGQTRAFTGEIQLGTQEAEQKPIRASREPPSQGAHPCCREESVGQAPPAGGIGLRGETKPTLLRRQWVTHDNI